MARAEGVVAGLPVVEAVLVVVSAGAAVFARRADDGDRVRPGDVLLTVTGPTRALLTGERTALNLLCHLSCFVLTSRRWVAAVARTRARFRDPRKTLPGLEL